MILTIKDESPGGKLLQELILSFETEVVTVKDIITERVLQEVDTYNKKLPLYFNGLVEPTESERTINGFKLKARRVIDGEQQVYTALNAFQKNAFFVLIDDIQAESLEQEIELNGSPLVSFIKLTPLVGG
jgi:hypothetical protein